MNIVVVDDEFYARMALENQIRDADPSVIVHPGMDFVGASMATEWQIFDQVYLDLSQPLTGRPADQTYGQDNEHPGCEIVRHIRRSCPRGGPAVIVVTSQQASFDSDYVRAWLRVADADGFIYRHSLPSQLAEVLARGRSFRERVTVSDEFAASDDSKLLGADIQAFVDLVRTEDIAALSTDRPGEEQREKLWKRLGATRAPIGPKRKKERTLRLFHRLARILPTPRHRP